MNNSIVVYRIISENPDIMNLNVSYATARQLTLMGIVTHSQEDYEVIRQGDVTVTVYSYRKV